MSILKNKIFNNKKGSTLIEVLISLALLALIITVFIRILNSSVALRTKSDIQSEANAIAMSQIEELKELDAMPSTFIPEEAVPPATLKTVFIQNKQTADHYDIQTQLTDVTSTLFLQDGSLAQDQSSGTFIPDINITIGLDELSVINPVLSTPSISLNGLGDNPIVLDISAVAGAVNTYQYALNFKTPAGPQTINLGNYNRISGIERLFKITALPTLSQNINWDIDDRTGERLRFSVFDDSKNKIHISVLSTSNSTLKISQNMSSIAEPSKLSQKYYEVLVRVSLRGQEYAKLLSSWTIKGD